VSRALARAALIGVCAANLLLAVDLTAMALMLPALADTFGADAATLSWMLNAYPVALAAALPFTTRVFRRWGSGVGFAVGALLLAAGTGVAALSPDAIVFVAGRLAAGAGAAALLANGLALLRDRTPPEELPRAIGVSSTFTAIGLAIGPVLIGSALEVVTWSPALLVIATAAAILAAGSAVTARSTPVVPPPAPPGSLRMAAVVSGTIVAAAVAIHQAGPTPWISAGFAVIAIAGATIVVRDLRGTRGRLLPRVLARDRGFFTAVAVGALAYGATAASQPFQSLLLASQGWSSGPAGAFLLTVTAGVAAGTLLSGSLVARRGVRTTVMLGFALAAVGLVLLVPFGLGIGTVVLAGVGNAVSGFGIGLASPQALAYGIARASERDAPSAASTLWTARQTASCLAYPGFALLLPHPGDDPQLAVSVMFAVATASMIAAVLISARGFPRSSAPGSPRAGADPSPGTRSAAPPRRPTP
jgi:MFS family permease